MKILVDTKNKTILGAIAGIVLEAGLTLPNLEAQKSGGGGKGLLLNIAANFIYDALTGNKVPVTPPMDGKITAKPKVEAFGGYRKFDTINGYAHDGLEPDIEPKRDPGYNDDKWTAYFDIDYGEVIDNPDYDPEAEPGRDPNSNKYILPSAAEFNDHGDQFKSRGTMKREYSTAKKGYVYDDDGNRYVQFSKKGRWVYVGQSERIKCEHRLKNKIKTGDARLAKSQTYRAEVWWKLDYVTWSKDEEDFKVVRTDEDWRKEAFTMSATNPDSIRVKILPEKNTWVYTLTEKGQSQLYWVSRIVNEAWKTWKDPYTLWERKQHDELKEQEKEGR